MHKRFDIVDKSIVLSNSEDNTIDFYLNPDDAEKQIILGSGTCGGIDTMIKFNPSLIEKKRLQAIKNNLHINNLLKFAFFIWLISIFIPGETWNFHLVGVVKKAKI